jgi:2-iminobutanoate/2-iminopropanoate deaminase
MSNESIQANAAPAAIGPYSQAVRGGDTIYVSGQLPIDPKTGAFSGDSIESQTEQSLRNIRAILAAAGTDLNAVVKTTVYLKNMGDFSAMNTVYERYFSGLYPARVAVEVARLPKDALVEIDAIAVL